ncbi:MAG: hypothetical protein U5O39_20070 [Gammaproteobacteria bacterium]|nr:hypothetical protein [Gammaproteobacteria bacterium]
MPEILKRQRILISIRTAWTWLKREIAISIQVHLRWRIAEFSSPHGRRMRLELHAETIDDLNDAVEFYEQQQFGLGDERRQEIYRTIARI